LGTFAKCYRRFLAEEQEDMFGHCTILKHPCMVFLPAI
jgi:hypothetical protein